MLVYPDIWSLGPKFTLKKNFPSIIIFQNKVCLPTICYQRLKSSSCSFNVFMPLFSALKGRKYKPFVQNLDKHSVPKELIVEKGFIHSKSVLNVALKTSKI